MKKCPRCKGFDDDSVRFCKKCGTELFFDNRFPEMKSLKSGIKLLISKIIHAAVLKKD